MDNKLEKSLKEAAKNLVAAEVEFKIDLPDSPLHGDVFTNAPLVLSKQLGKSPRSIAEDFISELEKTKPDFISKMEIAGPGFINFWFKAEYVAREVLGLVSDSSRPGDSDSGKGKKVLVEYTDPNTFKVFHIGHLMSNAIGESISRLIESSGSKVVRLCYPSDIGLHIAKAIWALQKNESSIPADSTFIEEKTDFLGKMYVEGTKAYENDESARDDIDALNKVIYEKSSPAVDALYKKGREWSLDHFDKLYELLGTKFDDTIYESEMASVGLAIVNEQKKRAIFEESDGAIVFKGEDHGLHTRVFVNSKGLPTYEAKDVGLNVTKFERHPDADKSIIVTASEQNDYFKVLLKVFSIIDPKHGHKTSHIGHGMMRFASGKMSSRIGNVITAESLIEDIKSLVAEKIADRDFSVEEKDEVAEIIAVGAIKYTILRSAVGSDIVFDSAASISFEGDSGPYLQYAVVRANSLLEKAISIIDLRSGPIPADIKNKINIPEQSSQVEKILLHFSDVVKRAQEFNSPHLIATYLIELAGAYNQLYAVKQIIDKDDPLSIYYIAVTRAFRDTLVHGLWILGIKVPKKM